MRATRSAAAVLLVATLSACSPSVALQPAADATDPECAAVVVRLPDTVAGLASRETNAQATGAWGSPADVLLRCGVPPPDPTATLPCVTVEGVDWLRDSSDDPNFVFTTYGRTPAVEVIINGESVNGLPALTDLADAVGVLPAARHCIAPEDTG